jgi:TetR/AcrR family transcriptional regulator, ethionamide resistance regulator
MPPTTRSRQSDRESRRVATRDKLRQALEEFHAAGIRYTEISVEKISATADLTRTTFYAHFEDKVDVLVAWLEDVRAAAGSAPTGWAARDRAPSRAELRQDVADALARYRPHTAVLAAARDTALFDSRADAAYRAFVQSSIDDLSEHIERGRRGGWIQPDLPPTEVATWLASMVHRTLSATPPLDDYAYMDRLDDYTDIFWNTLYRCSTSSGGRLPSALRTTTQSRPPPD